MSQVCEICGKHPVAGRSISHSHRVTNRTFRPNIQKVSVVVDGKSRKISCSHRGRLDAARPLHRRLADVRLALHQEIVGTGSAINF